MMPLFWLTILLLISTPSLATQQCNARNLDASRIVVAGGSVTELIYFLGEEQRLIGVDRTSNYPEAAKTLPQIGYVRALSAEGLLSLKPTLVLGENDMGPPEVLARLERTGVGLVKVPEAFTPQGVMEKLRCVGDVLAVSETVQKKAEAKLESSLYQLQQISQRATSSELSAVLVLMFTDGAPVAAGAATSGDGLIRMSGLTNALANMEGWKPLSRESLIQANPDILILTNRAVASIGGLERVYENPAIRLTRAGRTQQVIEMDGMTLLGFGPRTLDAAVLIATTVEPFKDESQRVTSVTP